MADLVDKMLAAYRSAYIFAVRGPERNLTRAPHTAMEDSARVMLKAQLERLETWPPSEQPIDKAIRGSAKRFLETFAKENRLDG